ncbi:MAG: putative amidohydrolase YtcJ [Arenicella sp.]|jgi:predicted amidohydrolase YtcJ
MHKIFTIFAISISAILLSLHSHAITVDTVLTNGTVYSPNWGEPSLAGNAPYEKGQWQADVSSVDIKNNKILYLGDESNLASLIDDDTTIIDVNSATVILA